MTLVDTIIQRFGDLRSHRATWEAHWQDVGVYTYPRRQDFYSYDTPGGKKTTQLYDSTGVHVVELLAAALFGMLMNPASKWFGLTTGPKIKLDGAAKRYIEDVTDEMYEMINDADAGFNTQLFEDAMEYVAFGTSAIFVQEDPIRRLATFHCRALSELYIAENAYNQIDTVYRRFKWSVRQVMQRWPKSASSDVRMKALAGKWDETVDIIHAIQPRVEFRPMRSGSRVRKSQKPVASIYVEEASKQLLEDGGFEEMPLLVSRFFRAPSETYGRSPAMTALPDIKLLNKMQETTIRAAEKVVDPPMSIPHDAFLHPFTIVAGGLNYRRRGEHGEVETFGNHGDIPLSLEMMDSLRQRIRDVFFLDQLELNSKVEMTATEIIERSERNMRILGPVIGRYYQEKLSPLLDRVFNIGTRLGRFPKPPSSLQGVPLTIDFKGPLVRAQKQIELMGIQRWVESSAPFLQLDPKASVRIDVDSGIQKLAELTGVSQEFFKSDAEVEQDKKLAEMQEQKQQMLSMAESGGRAAKDIATAEATRDGG